MNVHPVEELLHAHLADGALHFRPGDAGLQAQANLRSRFGAQHVPALGLAAGLAHGRRHLIIRMHLDRELVPGEEKFDQQGKTRDVAGGFTQQIRAEVAGDGGKRLSGKRAIVYAAIIAGEPGFANRRSCDFPRVNRRKIARAPGTLMKPRLQ